MKNLEQNLLKLYGNNIGGTKDRRDRFSYVKSMFCCNSGVLFSLNITKADSMLKISFGSALIKILLLLYFPKSKSLSAFTFFYHTSLANSCIFLIYSYGHSITEQKNSKYNQYTYNINRKQICKHHFS